MTWFWIFVAAYCTLGLALAIPFMIGLKRWAPQLQKSWTVTVLLIAKWSLEWLPILVMYLVRLSKRRGR